MSANVHQDDTLIADLVRAGLDADLVGRVSTLFAMFAVLREQSVTSANKKQEGNVKARERMAKKRAAAMEPSANTPKDGSVFVSKTLTTESIKKEVKQALQFSESASDEAVAFAGSTEISWPPDRIATEWQRFRDYNLTHGKQPKNVMAAWRNWCRSPYRSAPPPPQPKTKPLAPGQLPVAKEPVWMKPPPGCRTEEEIMASMYPKGKPNGK